MKSSSSTFSFRRFISFAPFVFLLALFVTLSVTPIYAGTLTVTSLTDDVSDTGSLRYAIENATSQDVITFDLEYSAIITLNEQLSIDHGLTIQGPGADFLSISGGGECRVFYIEDTAESVDISGISIVSGDAGSDDGGGGLYNLSDNLTITTCTLSSNSAGAGGGMFNYESDPTVTNCTFSSNSAGAGGGMFNYESDSTVTNCTFSSNNSEGPGGGMCNLRSDPTVTNCTFSSNNSADVGGGMYNDGSSPTVINCTFIENSAVFAGGGMYNFVQSSPEVTNCTFSSNNSGWQGGGMYNEESSPEVTNCIFWNNAGGEIDNSETMSVSPTLRYCVVQSDDVGNGTISNDIISADPILQSLAKDNGGPTSTCALGVGSSAIDAGIFVDTVSTDQRGVARPQGTGYDIGAYEYEPHDNRDGCNISVLPVTGLLLVIPLMLLSGKIKLINQ